MIVCFCHPTSERDVDAIIDDGARTVEDIGRRCGAGTGCGSCLEELRDRLVAKGCAGCPRDADGADETRDTTSPLVELRPR
ncbi:MAG: (2Fe-2S)-binding protein [Deltaproteobacteria bacterium]|nr:(2Fe-2S)-binding protein [Deltaproteobacteria bacterium]